MRFDDIDDDDNLFGKRTPYQQYQPHRYAEDLPPYHGDRGQTGRSQPYWVPRPSRLRSSQHHMHGFAWGLWTIVLAVLIGADVLSYLGYQYYFGSEKYVTITVSRLDDQSTGSGHQYLIFTKQGTVYKDKDNWLHGKTNSSDLFAFLQVGRTYRCDIYGYRNHLLSNYPNLINCIDVKTGRSV